MRALPAMALGSAGQVGSDHPGELFEPGQRLVPAIGWDVVDAALDPGLRHPLDLAGIRLGVYRYGDGSAARGPRHLLELRNAFDSVATVRHPTIGVADHPLEDLRPASTKKYRRMRFLTRLRPAPHRREMHHVAVVLRLILGPDRLDCLDPFAQELPPGAEVGPVVGHLLSIPAGADAEDEAPIRDQIDARDFLGGVDGIALDQ